MSIFTPRTALRAVICFLIFAAPFAISAQNNLGRVAQKVQDFKNSNARADAYYLFSSTTEEATENYSSAVSEGLVFDLDPAQVSQLKADKPDFVKLLIPSDMNGNMMTLELYREDIHAPGFRVKTNDGSDITDQVDLGLHYRGVVDGENNSLVSISIFDDQVNAFIEDDRDLYTLGKLDNSDIAHILYKTDDLNTVNDLDCATEDDGTQYTDQDLSYTANRDPGDCIQIYVEAGSSVYDAFGGNLANTMAFLNGVFAESFVIYANDGLTLEMSELFIWTTVDPYVGPSSSNYLSQFQANTGAINGDLGHIVEVDNVGGIAAGFSGICAADVDDSKCFSGFSGTNYNSVPTYSFNVYIITHEMGHLIGSRHTHACVWNGNSTAIDGCSGFTEGGCALPPAANPGTIMSYCTPNISFTEGFHPQPAAVILNTVNNAMCLTACAAPDPCIVEKGPDQGAFWLPINNETGTYVYANSFVATATGAPTDLGTWLLDASGAGDLPNIRFEVWGDTGGSGPDPGTILATTGSMAYPVTTTLAYYSAPAMAGASSLTSGSTYWFIATVVGEVVATGSYQVGGHTQNSVYVDNGTFWFSNDMNGINFDGTNLTPEMAFSVDICGAVDPCVPDNDPPTVDCGAGPPDNYTTAPYAYSYVDISGTGVKVASGDDNTSIDSEILGPVNLGAPFTLYGVTYTQLTPGTNGYITNDLADTGGDLSNDCPLPDNISTPFNGPGMRIYPHHDDLDIDLVADPGSGVFYEYFAVSPVPAPDGSSPGVSIFQWKADHFNASGPADLDFQALLFNNGEIVFQYNLAGPETGSGSTQGVQSEGPNVPTFGTTISCNQVGTVTDGSAVALIPQFVPLQLTFDNDPGMCGAQLMLPQPAAMDACGPVALVNDYNNTDDASDFYPIGVTTVTWTATDGAGNMAMCSYDVTVVDVEPIMIDCGVLTTVNADNYTQAAYAYNYLDITGTGTVVVTGDDSASGAVTLGSPVELYEMTFAQLNVSTNGYITTDLLDGGPDLSNDCPLPATPSTPGGTTGVRIYPLHDDLESDPAQDPISGVYYQYFAASPVPSPSGAPMGVSVFQWRGDHFNAAGTADLDFECLIFDNGDIVYQYRLAGTEQGSGSTQGIQSMPPPIAFSTTISCNTPGSVTDGSAVALLAPMEPADQVVFGTDADACGADLDLSGAPYAPVVTDNCMWTLVNDYNGTDDASDFYPVGETIVNWTATDEFGNEVTCSQTIVVVDDDGPELICPDDIVIGLQPGECEAYVLYDIMYTDNCAMDAVISQNVNDELVNNSLDCTATDLFANHLRRFSNTSANPLGFKDISFGIRTSGAAGANITVSVYSIANGDPLTLGNMNLEGSVSHFVPAGLTNTIMTVEVPVTILPGNDFVLEIMTPISPDFVMGYNSEGQTAPTYIYGCSIAQPTDLVTFGFPAAFSTVLFVSNVTLEQTAGLPNGSFFPIGTTTQTYIATDGTGNTSTCTFDITVLEYPTPTSTLTCNNGLNVSMGPDCQVEVNADMMLEGTNYGCYDDYIITIEGVVGTIITETGTYSITITDPDTGNSCWGTITVEDKLLPTLDCPCSPEGDIVTEFSGTLETTDAFDPELAFNPGPGCFTFNQGQGPLYYDTYTFAIIDESGTQPTCDFAFEVMDAGGLDTYVYLYENSFNPNDICENLIALDDDGGAGLFSLLNTSQTPSNVNQYVFVITSTGFGGAPVTGDYTIEITPGDPNCEILLLINPDCTFSCTQLEAVMGGYIEVPEPVVTGGCTGYNLAYTDYVTNGAVCGQQILQRVWYVTDITGTITDQCVSEYIFDAVSFGEISLPPALVELPCGSGTDPADIAAYFDNPFTNDIATSANCPLDVVENNEGIPFAYPHYFTIGCDNNSHAQAVDNNVCNIYATYSDQYLDACGVGCDGNSKVIRTWTLLDWCTAATTDYVQIIKSIDQEAPTFVATDVFASVEVHACVAHIELPAPWELHDNCDENPWYSISGPAGVSIGGNHIDGYVAWNVPKGQHTFTYAAHDCCDNEGTQDITVTVQDNTAPVPVATQNIVISLTTSGDGQGIAKLYATSVDNGSHDSCSDVKIEIRRDTDNCGIIGNTTYDNTGHPQDNVNDPDGGAFVKFCCADLTDVDGNNVPYGIHKVWMRVWDDGDMNGIYGTSGDNYNEIWVNVRVEDKLAPAIVCPPDVTIECDQDHTDLDLVGEATAYGTCDGLEVDYTDTDFLSACNEGFVQRRWFIAGNPFGTFCIQRITIQRNDPPFNGVITWPNDMTVNCTDANPGEPTWVAGPCDVIGYDVDSDTFLFEDGACFKILNEYTVIDWCQYEPNSPFWNGEGIWTHTQIIKVIDNVAPEITCEDAMYAVNDNDDVDGDGNLCENRAVMLTNSAVDGGGDCMSEWLKWQIEVDIWGDNTVDYVFSSFVPPFSPFYVQPTGSNEEVKVTIPEDIESSMANHKVFWQVTDGCGNNAGCGNTFMVVDKKAPTPYCVSLSSALMDESGMVTLWAIDFNIGSFDNCTEQEDLRYTFTSTAPEDDPLYDEDRRSSSQVFDCDDLPQVTVNMYVWDEKGNSDFCVVTLNLVDNFEVCDGPGGRDIAGNIETEVGDGVEEVEVTLTSILPESPVSEMTVTGGEFMFADNAVGIDYSVEPGKNGDYMNGVSTLDLVLIQRHILNLELFTSPYKVIAADINSDEKVSAADLVQLRKLILGVNSEMADNTSWRFVDAAQTFEDVTHPWPFTEVIEITSLSSDMMDNDFIAAKIGDVNGSASANFVDNNAEVRSNKALTLKTIEQTLTAGQEVSVEINSADFADVYGYQFTIELNGLSYNGVTAGAVPMNAANVGVLKSNLVTVSYSNSDAVTAGSKEGIFTMTFTAEKAGQLSDMMKITSRVTQAEAYLGQSLEIQNVELSIITEEGAEVSDSYALNQNEPNPFKDATTISFYAPENASATITVYDVTGKVVAVRDMEAVKGHNETTFTKSDLGVSGILHYTLVSGDFTATKKMIIIE